MSSFDVTPTPLAGLIRVTRRRREDARGFFSRFFCAREMAEIGWTHPLAQVNHSLTRQTGAVRGLHFQHPKDQGKLVWCPRGAVWDVAVDVRKGSPTFGRWFGLELTEANKKQLWIPPGFAHGFCVLSEVADFQYKCTQLYAPDCELSVRWDDPAIGVAWPVTDPLLSKKDLAAPLLKDVGRLPALAP